MNSFSFIKQQQQQQQKQQQQQSLLCYHLGFSKIGISTFFFHKTIQMQQNILTLIKYVKEHYRHSVCDALVSFFLHRIEKAKNVTDENKQQFKIDH